MQIKVVAPPSLPPGVNKDLFVAAGLMLRGTGEDPEREGLLRTPARFAKAFDDLCAGYAQTPRDVVGEGVFAAEGRGLITVKDVEFYSLCEHHMLPFWGTATVAYYPGESILGLSKIPRLVDVFARRLQVQERVTEQVADALVELVAPRAVAVKVTARHLCMMMRGVEKQGGATATETFRGLEALSEVERQRMMAAID